MIKCCIILLLVSLYVFAGCMIDLEPETKEFMEEVQRDCLGLEDELSSLYELLSVGITEIAYLNSEIAYLRELLDYYGIQPEPFVRNVE